MCTVCTFQDTSMVIAKLILYELQFNNAS
jgi:hypothetical protein